MKNLKDLIIGEAAVNENNVDETKLKLAVDYITEFDEDSDYDECYALQTFLNMLYDNCGNALIKALKSYIDDYK